MWRRIEPGEYRGTCEGLPRSDGRSAESCTGVNSRDFMRGRKALWVGPRDHRLCGSCKKALDLRAKH